MIEPTSVHITNGYYPSLHLRRSERRFN